MQETQEMQVRPLSREDPLQKDLATYSNKYSCLENPMDRGAWGLQSKGSQRVGHN